MDLFRDGQRQQELQAMADEQRRRSLARARSIGKGALAAAAIVGLIGTKCNDITSVRKRLLFKRPVIVGVSLGFVVTLVLVGVAVYAVRELRRTKQPIWVAVAAIVIATIGLGPWGSALLDSLWLNHFPSAVR